MLIAFLSSFTLGGIFGSSGSFALPFRRRRATKHAVFCVFVFIGSIGTARRRPAFRFFFFRTRRFVAVPRADRKPTPTSRTKRTKLPTPPLPIYLTFFLNRSFRHVAAHPPVSWFRCSIFFVFLPSHAHWQSGTGSRSRIDSLHFTFFINLCLFS